MARALKIADQQIKELTTRNFALENKIEQDKPLVEFANTVGDVANDIDMGELAKLMNKENINIGRNRLFSFLKEQKILMDNNLPYQKYITNGYFNVVEVVKKTPYGDKVLTKTLVTGKGQLYLVKKVKELYCEKQ